MTRGPRGGNVEGLLDTDDVGTWLVVDDQNHLLGLLTPFDLL